MKFWQKIFFSVLALILVCINISMFVMMQLFSESTKNAEKDFAVYGAYVAKSQLYEQFMSFFRYGTLQYDNKKRCFEYCSSNYQYKNAYLQYYEYDTLIFNSFPGETVPVIWNDAEIVTDYLMGDAKINWISYRGMNYIAVRMDMDYPFESRALVYIYPLEKYEARRNALLKSFVVIELIFTALTGLLLYFIIKGVTKPLPRLSEAVTKIAAGKYNEKLPVVGKDEIAILSGKINDLSLKISESIEALKTSAEEKQNFIDDLGHEIRTPLTSISGYAEYLNMAAVTEEERKQSLDYIISESHRLEHLSKTLLELASIREGKISKTEIDAKATVTYIEQIFLPRMKEASISLETSCETDVIYCDRELLYMLICNLLENAVRASKEGGIIRLDIRNMRSMGYKKTVITIKDNGIGMKTEELLRIEEPFYRVDKARSRESGGVGLGVSLCKQIVKVHDGTMKYDSVPEKGTTVTVVLPESDNVFELV